jgi:hypothetical protein
MNASLSVLSNERKASYICINLSVRDRNRTLQDVKVDHQQFPTEGCEEGNDEGKDNSKNGFSGVG